jgi:hypothetical protein
MRLLDLQSVPSVEAAFAYLALRSLSAQLSAVEASEPIRRARNDVPVDLDII